MRMWQILAIIAMFPATATAQTYVELRAGAIWLQDERSFTPFDAAQQISAANVSFDTGWTGAIALGRQVGQAFRVEIEFSHRTADVDSTTGLVANPTPPPPQIPFSGNIPGDVTIDALMINGYVDASSGLYVGLGAGAAFTDTTFDGIGRTDTRPAFQVMAGITFPVNPSISVTVGYNLFMVRNVALGNGESDVTSHGPTAGLRVGF